MKIALVPNNSNSQATQAALFMQSWLERQHVEVVFGASDGAQGAWQGIGGARYRTCRPDGTVEETSDDVSADVRSCDLVISFGGDGTTLHAARLIGFSGVPLLSINFGHLGFLSGGMADEMVEVVQTVLAGEVTPSARATLSVKLNHEDGSSDCYFAFNEVLLEPAEEDSIMEFTVSVNDTHLFSMRGDGIIVSSATGSTAHALSAGGPMVAPGHRGPIIVPVAPHTLASRPVVCESSDVAEVRLGENAQRLVVAIDGKHAIAGDLASVEVSRGEGDVYLLQPGQDTFYRSCAETFFRS